MTNTEKEYTKKLFNELNRIQSLPLPTAKLEDVCYATKRAVEILIKGQSKEEWSQGYIEDLKKIK